MRAGITGKVVPAFRKLLAQVAFSSILVSHSGVPFSLTTNTFGSIATQEQEVAHQVGGCCAKSSYLPRMFSSCLS